MNESAHLVSRYWRDSLADAELGQGGFDRKKADAFHCISDATLRNGRLQPAELEALFRDQPAEAQSRSVVLRLFVYWARTEHGRAVANVPEIITPLAGPAVVFRDGHILPAPGVAAPRDLLEPPARFALGSLDDLDDFLTENPSPSGAGEGDAEMRWAAYVAYCEKFLKAVFPNLAKDSRLDRMAFGYMEPVNGGGAAANSLIALYDALRADDPKVPLFERVATVPSRPPEPCLPPEAMFAKRLGHSSPDYPLAAAQRGALAHLLAAGDGEVLAVNGPPGTGKTTLLLSVVASLWAEAALAGREPPVIVAASTNNQAVKNVIDAFGSDFAAGEGPFAGRWLPEVTSFGSYFPARSQKDQKDVERYQTEAFFEDKETTEYLARAQQDFLEKGSAAFPELSEQTVERLVEALHGRLRAQASELAALETAWAALCAARDAVRELLGEAPSDALAELRRRADQAQADLGSAETLVKAWEAYQGAEPVLLVLLAWLPQMATKRLHRARSSLRSAWPGPLPDWKSVSDIPQAVAVLVESARLQRDESRAALDRAEAALRTERDGLERWREALRPLQIEPSEAVAWTLEMCDPAADRLIRFPIFLTTTHYWEGRWLKEVAAIDLADEKDKKGRKALTARWQRRMMLTPCTVSTFHSLPKRLTGRRREGKDWGDDYLWDFLDLLIVDEAGQVTPEVGATAFALAKRALVIGDTHQIPPIPSVPSWVDEANLVDAGLLTQDDLRDGRDPVVETGRGAASGSVMLMSQHASRYHQDPDLARGLMLYEHRRCFDEIIGYSNALCYAGKLKPMRGSKPKPMRGSTAGAARSKAEGLPALGYAHIDGRCEQAIGGSRHNLPEAQAIALWLTEQKTVLEAAYPETALDQIVCVIAPFAAQVRAIKKALDSAGIGIDRSVGTVHAFQGGQRPVVLFSPTYSKLADGGFIDRDASLLNVAVSRAQDSFLVFGDMDLLSRAPVGCPRGRLGQFLFSEEANRLPFQPPPPSDLISEAGLGLAHLRDAPAHDAFLRDVLASAEREVHIVTPWIARRVIEETDVAAGIAAAAERGVAITIYTDAALNADRASRASSGGADYAAALQLLQVTGAEIVEVQNVHSKIVMADDQTYCVGSFNWLSAARDGKFARHETSLVYRSHEVAREIDVTKADLRRRRGREGRGGPGPRLVAEPAEAT